ncbi:P2Y purinoceptor 3-like [Latimeria chalumnae]|uniref:P2Y purinoceptor 3-like n=1 Tax=Latimeria chalumnae TaxID=7897 RepID=UPI00313A8794
MSGDDAPLAPTGWAQVLVTEAATAPLTALTRRHGVKCFLHESLTVEAYVKAMAKVVGPSHMMAASKMYGKAVFLKLEAATHKAVEQGISIRGPYVSVKLLSVLGTKEGYKHILLPITYSLFFLLGLVLNGAVILLSRCRIKNWTCTTIYLVNLAVANLFYVCLLPLLIASYAMRDQWPFGNIACKLVHFFFYTNLYGSILFLTCISVHLFLGMCYPLKSINYRTKKAGDLGTSVTWMVVIELLPTFLYAHTATLGDCTICYDLTNPGNFTNYFPYGITLTVSGFLLPFVIILIILCDHTNLLLFDDQDFGTLV